MAPSILVRLTKESAITAVIFLSACKMNSANRVLMTYSPGFNVVSMWTLVNVLDTLSFLA